MARVLFDGVRKQFDHHVTALDNLDLEIHDGEFAVLVGPSGCGKSTALRCLAGLESVTRGDIWIGDRTVTRDLARQRDVAMVFQSYALFPHMSVRDNVGFGMKIRGESKSETNRRVSEAAAMLGLSELLDRRPSQLSGGQRQRVALGRAVVREPKAFLMDEPLSNLDAQLRVQMRAEIVQLQKRLATTMIYVTHDQVEAMTMGDRIAVMRTGVLQQVGSPRELYEHPVNLFVARFLGSPSMNVVPARVTDRSDGALLTADGLEMPLPRARARKIGGDGNVLVGLRPEHFVARDVASRGDGSVRLPVKLVESLGSECLVHLDGPGGAPVVARLGSDVRATAGQPLELAVEDRHVHLFDPETELALA